MHKRLAIYYTSLYESVDSAIARFGGPEVLWEERSSIEEYSLASKLAELRQLTRRLPVGTTQKTLLAQAIRFAKVADAEGLRAIKCRDTKRDISVMWAAVNNLNLASDWLDAVVAWICAIIEVRSLAT
jgi:hypothetical protein